MKISTRTRKSTYQRITGSSSLHDLSIHGTQCTINFKTVIEALREDVDTVMYKTWLEGCLTYKISSACIHLKILYGLHIYGNIYVYLQKFIINNLLIILSYQKNKMVLIFDDVPRWKTDLTMHTDYVYDGILNVW